MNRIQTILSSTVMTVLLLSQAAVSQAGTLNAVENAYGRKGPSANTVQSTAAQILINNQLDSSRKAYIRFDVSSLPADVLTADFIIDYKAGRDNDTIRVNVLNDGFDETWSNGVLTWNNAPANNTASGSGFTSDATLLTTTAMSGGLSDGDDVVLLSGSALVNLINDERNGVGGRDGFISFALAKNGGSNAAFHSIEGAPTRAGDPPRIVFTLVPEPTSLVMFGLGSLLLLPKRRR